MDKNTPIQHVEPGLLKDIGEEVSQESAPLLEFITKHGAKIALAVGLFLLVACISGLVQWYGKKGQLTALEEIAKISMQQKGHERLASLKALQPEAPSSVQTILALSIADSASTDKDYAEAEAAYAMAAKHDADGPTGLMAQLCQANCLLHLGKAAEALALLQSIEKRFENPTPLALRQLMADAAVHSGQKDLARTLYQGMASDVDGEDAAYLRKKAEDLAAQPTDDAAKAKP